MTVKYEEALWTVKNGNKKKSGEQSWPALSIATINYSQALRVLNRSIDEVNVVDLNNFNAKSNRYYNYLVMLDPTSQEGTNPATLVAIYRTLCLNDLRKSNIKVFNEALRCANVINMVCSKARGQRKKFIHQQLANLNQSVRSRLKTDHTFTTVGFNQQKAITLQVSSGPVGEKGKPISTKFPAMGSNQVFFSDSEIFRMIALSVINEAKSDNIRLLCSSCHDRSKRCDNCAFENTSLSLTEKENLKRIQENMWEEVSPVEPTRKIVMCKYLLKEPAEILYHPKFSNYNIALNSSNRLYIKLKKNGLLERFHQIFKEELDLDYYDLIDPSEMDPTAPVYFSSINYVLVVTNVKNKLRPINNCSAYHRNGSLNENTIIPPCIEADPIKMLVAFRTQQYCGILDLKNAFKSLYSHESSNNIRNFVWIRSMDDHKMVVWRPKRVNFGSSLSSIFLHVARIKFVAKMVKTPEALASVVDLTFVDDEIFHAQSPDELEKVREEICAAYNMYSFEVKHVFLSTQDTLRTQFLALDWIINQDDGRGNRQDVIKPNIFLSLENKKRGKNGAELTLENLESLVLTKTVAARLLGVLFSYLQCDINPVLASAKIHYTKVATVCKDWKSPIKVFDEKIHEEFHQFVRSLVGINERLKPTKRVILPHNSVIERILIVHDAGTFLMAASVYIVSRDINTNKIECNIILSKNKVGRLSIPRLELLSTKIGLSLLIKFLRSCPRARSYQYPVFFLGDSEANTHNYNPEKVHKCVVTRNTTTIVMRGVKDIIAEYKNITAVKFAFLTSEENSADLVSKVFEDSIEVANSDAFKCGDAKFLDGNFPSSDKIFLTVTGSEVTYTPIIKTDGVKDPAEESYMTGTQNMARTWPIYFNSSSCCKHCDQEEGKLSGQVYSIQPSKASTTNRIDMHTVVGLEPVTYNHLVSKISSLNKILRTLARCKAVLRNTKVRSRPVEHFNSNDILFAFLTIVKSSQDMYGCEKESKRYQIIKVGNILCFRTRIPIKRQGEEISDRVIPYIPGKDIKLINLVIRHAHQVVIRDPLCVTHTSHSLTKARIQSGEFATFVPNVTGKIRRYITKCATCSRYKAQFATPVSSTHRFFEYYDTLTFFCFISIDISAPVMLRPSKQDKKPRKYFILVTLCLVSKAICLLLLEDYSKDSVATALGQIQLRYSGRIQLILSDNGTQLAALDPNDPVFTVPPRIVTCPTANQVLNPVESITGKVKKLISTAFLNKEAMSFPTVTVIQATALLDYISCIYNMRAVSGARQTDNDTVISPYALLHTYLNRTECDKSVEALLRGIEDKEDSMLDVLTKNRKLKGFLTQELKSLIISNNENFLQKTGKEGVRRRDICLIRRGTQLKLVKVIDINESNNFAKIEIIDHKKVKPTDTHVSQLVLIHRPEKESEQRPR